MRAEKQYTKYLLKEGDFMLRVKIGEDITFQNKDKGNSKRFANDRAKESVFVFKRSSPEMIDKFAKAMKLAVKLSKESA